ncbi:hypothetical protein [Microvirga antarctica]|uniref:hypothetical protein n=1 Tax=Microvirga antarctica TaxID=2819233 RepID=UPI001B309C0E|nr:hypothetical protein [Microvirga antarctica]
MTRLSRRQMITGLAGVAFCAPPLAALAQTQAFPQFFSSLSVDVSVLKAKGLGGFADLVGAATLDELRRSFADRIDRRGPRLVVRLTGIDLTAFPDGGGERWWGRGSGGGTDSINGEALAIGPRGEVIARHPQLAVLDVRTSILTPNEHGRAVAVAQHYVRWLRRELIS